MLRCKDSHKFECWFPTIQGCDEQLKDKLVSCPICFSNNVEKDIMSPFVSNSSNNISSIEKDELADRFESLKEISAIKQYMKDNYLYVGTNFANLARDMHSGKIDYKDIYGVVSIEDYVELSNEGIDTIIIPANPDVDDDLI